MKNRLNPFLGTLVVIAMTHSAHAASATWNGTADATWAGANWSVTPVPGTDDIATFDNAGNGKTTIDLGAGVTVGNIIFDNAAVAAYTIGSGTVGSQTLTLNNSGTITANNTIAANQIFNAKLVLGTDATAQSYSITNKDASNLLTFAGGISGGTGGTAGAKILNVASDVGSITLSGAITDGGASSLGLAFTAVSGKPTILISGGTANTYTGGTSVGSGIRLNVGTANSLGSGLVTVASGGQVFLNSAGTYSNNFIISGSSWDAGGGALRMGNGATNTINGNVTLAGNSRIGVDASKTGIINGLLSGAYALEKVGTGLLTLGGANSSIGNLTITAGTVRTENNMTFGNVDVAASATFNPGGANAGYTVNINGLSGAGALTTANSGGFGRTLNVGNGDATSEFSGVITKSGNRGLTLNKVGAGTLTLSGTAANVDGGGGGSFATNISAGTLTLNKTGVVALPGATVAVNGGTLKISGTGGNQIADTAVLTLAGGSVEMAAASQTETIASTTLNAGASSVTQSQTASVLNMNVITRNVGGTINFGAGGIATTDNNNSNGILGGWATVGGTDWAKSVDSGAADTAISAFGSYTTTTTAGDTAANYLNANITVDSNQSPAAVITPNSLRFNNAAANTLTLTGTTNTITSGGILVTSAVASNLSTITGGTLRGASGKDLVIIQNNTSNGLTIESIIANNTAATGLTKSGAGLLTLSSSNTFTGGVTISGGNLQIANAGALNSTVGSENAVAFGTAAKGSLSLNGNSVTVANLTGSAVGPVVQNANASTAATLTVGNSANSSGTYAGIIQDGTSSAALSLTKTGSGTLTLSGANTYTGATLVSAGTLTLSSSLALQNSVLDTLNSIAGNATNGLKTTVTTLTLGGLTGNKNLADVFTTTSGGYSTVTTLTLNPGTSVTHSYSGSIADGASAMVLAKSGAGTQVLSGSNSYSGGTTISGGTLSLSGSGTLGATTGALSFTGNSTTLNIGSTTQTVASVTAGSLSNNWSSTITGTGGTLNVSGNLVYQGNSGNGSTYSTNPTLGIDTDVTVAGNTLLGRANLTISSGTYSTANFNQATGSADWASLIIQGTANVTAGSIDMRNLSAATGQVVLNGGTLTTGSIKAVDRENTNSYSILLFNGTQVIASGSSTTFVQVTAGASGANQAYIGTGGALINSNGNNVTITAALKNLSSTVVSNDTGLGGATAGAGFLTKSGAGTLTLTGTNTYTGETKVDEGKLVVNGSVSTSITTTVASGATLAGIGTVGAATISGILAPGNSIGTITATGDVTWNDNDAWVFELGSSASTLALAGSGSSIQDMLNITGIGSDFLKGTGSSFTFDFANTGAVGFYKLVDWAGTSSFSDGDFLATNLTSGLTATFTVDGGTSALYLNVVPEPDAATMVGSLGVLSLLRRRRK